MRTSTAPNATPHSTPPSSRGSRRGAGGEQYIWTSLVPRLIHPTTLTIIEALIETGKPLSIEDLAPHFPALHGDLELVERHVRSMLDLGVLEVSSTQGTAVDEVPLFYFTPERSGNATASPVAAVAHRHHKED